MHIILQSLPEPILWRPVAGFIESTLVITLPKKPIYLERTLTALLSSSLHRMLLIIKEDLTSDSIADEDQLLLSAEELSGFLYS